MKPHVFFFFIFALEISYYFAQKKDTTRLLEPDLVYYNKGCQLIDSTDYKEAIKLFHKALKINSQFTQAINKIAYCKYKLGDGEGAEKELQKSLELDPDNLTTIKYYGFILFEDKKFRQAKACLDSARKLSTLDHELDFLLGCINLSEKNLKTALANFNSAIEIKNNYADAFLKRGFTYFEMKNYKNCLADLGRYQSLNPNDTLNTLLFSTKGNANYNLQNFAASISDYSQLLKINPKNDTAYLNRGAAKIETGDFSGAIDDETNATKIRSNSYAAFNLRGVAKASLKSYAAAIEDFDKAIKLKFDFHPAYVNRASVRYAMKDKKKACDDLYKADQLGSNTAFKIIEQYCKD